MVFMGEVRPFFVVINTGVHVAPSDRFAFVIILIILIEQLWLRFNFFLIEQLWLRFNLFCSFLCLFFLGWLFD
jgi:hypothetical protein